MTTIPPRRPAGRWRARLRLLRANPLFEWFTIAVILLSSVSVGVKSYDIAPLAAVLRVLDWLVTFYFLAELSVRIAAAGSWRGFFSRGWNVFDFVIVAASLIPIDENEYVFLARLLRLFRLMRLIYFVPKLRLLVGALLTAIPRMGYVALMMFIIFYMYGAVGNLIFGDINRALWGDIGDAMLTLFRVATLEDWTDVMYETMAVHPSSWIYFLSFIFLSTFVFLNMMIGVIVGVLQEEHDKTAAADRRADERDIVARLERIERRLNELRPGSVADNEKGGA